MVQRIHNSLELKAIREWRLESHSGSSRVRREDNSFLRYEIGASELGRYYCTEVIKLWSMTEVSSMVDPTLAD